MDAVILAMHAADAAVCRQVGEDLTRYYPGHNWMVGCNHDAGTVVIDLPYAKPLNMQNYAYVLYLTTILGADGRAAVMRAGGELLERFGLARRGAKDDTPEAAAEHGLIIDGARNKSKH